MQPIDDQHWAGKVYLWLERHLPKSRRVRIAGMVLLAVVTFLLVFLVFVQPVIDGDTSSGSKLLAYVVLFVICFASAFFLLFPIPGLSLVAMGLVFQQGGYYDPGVVAIVACAGWLLGDTGIYVAGAVGSASIEKQAPAPGRFREWLRKLMDTLQRFMRTHGTLAVGVLAAVTFIPNPIAGATLLAAGANRMRAARFISGVVVGRLSRGLILAYAGSQVVNV